MSLRGVGVFNNKTWMKQLNELTKLCDIFLPCSHNSGTGEQSCGAGTQRDVVEGLLYPFALKWDQCQTAGIAAQLEMGVRVLDLRITGERDHVWIAHALLYARLEDVTRIIAEFLRSNPSEFVVVILKRAWASLLGKQWCLDWSDVWKLLEDQCTNQLLDIAHDVKLNTSVGALRGKAVMICENEVEPYHSGITHASSWHQGTNCTKPDDLIPALQRWSDQNKDRQRERLLVMFAQCTPSSQQIMNSYVKPWSSSPSRLLHLHETSWPLVRKFVLPILGRPMAIALDFCTPDSCNDIIALNMDGALMNN